MTKDGIGEFHETEIVIFVDGSMVPLSTMTPFVSRNVSEITTDFVYPSIVVLPGEVTRKMTLAPGEMFH